MSYRISEENDVDGKPQLIGAGKTTDGSAKRRISKILQVSEQWLLLLPPLLAGTYCTGLCINDFPAIYYYYSFFLFRSS